MLHSGSLKFSLQFPGILVTMGDETPPEKKLKLEENEDTESGVERFEERRVEKVESAGEENRQVEEPNNDEGKRYLEHQISGGQLQVGREKRQSDCRE